MRKSVIWFTKKFQDLSYAITGISCNDRKAFTNSRKYMDAKEEREGVRTDTSI